MAATTLLWLFPLATLAAGAVLGGLRLLERRNGMAQGSIFGAADPGAVFLFDGQTLIDASDRARALLGLRQGGAGAWPRLMAHLAPHFPDVETSIGALPDVGRLRMTGQGVDPLTLVAEWRGGLRRITLAEPHTESHLMMLDALAQRAQEDELAALRRTAEAAPTPICREAEDGRVLWANAAYIELATQHLGDDAALAWPIPVLFNDIPHDGRMRLKLEITAQGAPEGATRAPAWFDCRSVPVEGGRIVYALPADAVVRAEANLHNFLLTLTRTFAHLPIGLAIFDQNRRLQMFNPALTDLTRLPVTFLSARPSLFAVIDAMRQGGVLPEPRDYRQWRQKIADLESDRAEDLQETWMLADGTSYRFTARPQAEGTLALLIEDITDDMLRSRLHHAHVELGQSVIDAVDEAIAVFDTAGTLVISNDALRNLWGDAGVDDLHGPDLPAILAHWQSHAAPDPVWQRLSDFVATAGARTGWRTDLRLCDGRALHCRVEAISGQATLVGFTLTDAVPRRPLQLAEPLAQASAMR